MPRLSLAILFATVLAAAPALAVVNTIGDVKPVAPGILLPIGQPGIDDDVDEVADWIDTEGNSARLGLADPTVPAGTANFPGSYAWLDERVWVNYETTQNILVGEDGYGQLEINGGSALRYQHVVLGGVSDQSSNPGDLVLTTTGASEDFDYLSDIADNSLSRNGYGVMTVTGVGSVFNNDPNLIPADLQAVINFANGADIGTTVTTTPDPTSRPVNGDADSTYDIHVGLLGGGELNVLAGGRVEIQDALQVATSSTSQGTVTVDGAGSYLAAYGRSEFDGNPTPGDGTQEFASYIGGNGNAAMTVSGSGRSDFFNGLSIGAANSSTQLSESVANEDAFASGSLLVTGAGSTVSVAPTLATSNAGDDLGNDADLAVGELRDLTSDDGMDNLLYTAGGTLVDAPDGTSTYGVGLLRIEDGGRVNVTGDGDVGVGYHGTVEVQNGTLSVNGDLNNDGRISGYGSVRGLSLDTTVYSTIIGGDPDAQPGNPATAPLQITLVGDGTGEGTMFTNRGSVAGLVALDVTGDIDNRGNIDIGGDLNGRSLITTVDSRLNGDASYGSPLRIRLAGTAQADQDDPAFRNRGALTGEIDLVTAGGIVNGDDLIDGNDSNGGVIDASGTIMSGTFLNHGKGTITVGPGKSLSILATGTETGLDNSLTVNSPFVRFATIREDGTSPAAADGIIDSGQAAFFQANLGSINVDGGSIELGRLTDTEPQPPFSTLHVNLFRNARFVDYPVGGGTPDETVGTITSSDGEVRFRDGVYNTGVMAFTGGDNVVGGEVINAGIEVIDADGPDDIPGTPDDNTVLGQGINYGDGGVDYIRPGILLVSGDGTTVTFEDKVINGGVISIGPFGNVVNFLGDFENNGTIDVAINGLTLDADSAYLTVAGDVTINGGTFALTPVGSALTFAEGFSLEIVSAANLADDSLFTNLDLPAVDDGLFWDIVYDEDNGEIRAEVIASLAVGADFSGDGLVTQADVDIWIRNAGIESGASATMGDVDLDGDVDLADYDLLMVQLQQGTPTLVGTPAASATVPEPTTLLLLALAGAGAIAQRR